MCCIYLSFLYLNIYIYICRHTYLEYCITCVCGKYTYINTHVHVATDRGTRLWHCTPSFAEGTHIYTIERTHTCTHTYSYILIISSCIYSYIYSYILVHILIHMNRDWSWKMRVFCRNVKVCSMSIWCWSRNPLKN